MLEECLTACEVSALALGQDARHIVGDFGRPVAEAVIAMELEECCCHVVSFLNLIITVYHILAQTVQLFRHFPTIFWERPEPFSAVWHHDALVGKFRPCGLKRRVEPLSPFRSVSSAERALSGITYPLVYP